MVGDEAYVGGVGGNRRFRGAVIAIAAAGITIGAAACSATGTQHAAGGNASPRSPGPQSSGGGRGGTGSWSILSCQVDVEYLDATTTADNYVPDTIANFRKRYKGNASSGASMAVVVKLINHTGGQSSLPTDLVVSFTDQGGSHVGSPQTFNNTDGTGYGASVAHGRGSGEKFSSTTLFSSGQAVTESPDIGTAVPQRPNLNCQASAQ